MKRKFRSVRKILISLLLATIYLFALPITPNLAASLDQDMDSSPLVNQNWIGEQKNLAALTISEKSPSSAEELLTDPQQADQCIVPPSMYSFTFGDFSEDKGKTAWYCQTKSYQVANLTNDPIEIYYRVIFQNLNGSELVWSQIYLQSKESFSANAFFNSGRGGSSNSLVEYNLPVDMVALYGTEECRKSYSSNMQEPPPFALQHMVPLAHPCPGPDGAGGLTPGGVPLYEQGGLPDDKLPEGTESVAQNEQPAGDPKLSPEQQIAELLIYQEDGRLDQWPGWSSFNDTQRQTSCASWGGSNICNI